VYSVEKSIYITYCIIDKGDRLIDEKDLMDRAEFMGELKRYSRHTNDAHGVEIAAWGVVLFTFFLWIQCLMHFELYEWILPSNIAFMAVGITTNRILHRSIEAKVGYVDSKHHRTIRCSLHALMVMALLLTFLFVILGFERYIMVMWLMVFGVGSIVAGFSLDRGFTGVGTLLIVSGIIALVYTQALEYVHLMIGLIFGLGITIIGAHEHRRSALSLNGGG